MTLPCSHLDEFFDGELDAGAATAFRTHLATCDACQRQLRGRMQEALVVGEAEPEAQVLPIARARAHVRTRTIAIAGAIVAVAAAAILVWSTRRSVEKPPQLAMAFTIEHGPAAMRGTSAHVGDTVHIQSRNTIWIYRGDHELVLTCPGNTGCRADGADFTIPTIGAYSIIVLAGEHVPAPRGDYDTDLAAANAANVPTKTVGLTAD